MPDALPERHTWVFRDPDTGEQREYVQRELTIEGEVALLALGSKAVDRLSAKGFPWSDLQTLIRQADQSGGMDWSLAQGLAARALGEVPDLGAEAAAVLLNILPDSKVKGHYAEEVAFIRRSLKLMRLYDMLRLFMAQNDYDRLTAPFRSAVGRAIAEATPVLPGANPDIVGTL
jgi:hypothetical protein